MKNTLRVLQVRGEPTRYYVESNSLVCKKDGKHLFDTRKFQLLAVGGVCPKCATNGEKEPGILAIRWHLVDLSPWQRNGECSCEWFDYSLRKRLRAMPEAEQAMGKARCSHIDAAREFALDLSLMRHDRERNAHTNQREENQP